MNKEPLAVTTYATKSYCYALEEQAGTIVANLRAARIESAVWILASDGSQAAKGAFAKVKASLETAGIAARHLICQVSDNDGAEQHANASNLVIATLQNAAWNEARAIGARQVWSLEADILPQAKALRCLRDVLAFDAGWYDVAMATYPNEAFLGGHGAVNRAILPNVYPEEREIPAELKKALDERGEALAELARTNGEPSAEQRQAWEMLDKLVEQCQPKANVFGLQAESWKRRGWFDYAYPGIGQGCIVPVDWVGLGCTLLSERALECANWIGYEGEGTQDLWLCSRVWAAERLRLAVTSHAICSHVKRRDGAFKILYASHQLGGEAHGHLRSRKQDWPAKAK